MSPGGPGEPDRPGTPGLPGFPEGPGSPGGPLAPGCKKKRIFGFISYQRKQELEVSLKWFDGCRKEKDFSTCPGVPGGPAWPCG